MKTLLVITAGLTLTAYIVWSVTMKMPYTSDTGRQSELTPSELALRPELRRHVVKLAGEIGERNLAHHDALSAAARYLGATLAEYGYTVQASEASTPAGTGLSSNLVVELRGTTRPEEIVVIGAHYDTAPGAPGADDNATGCAAVLALARAFAGKPQERTLRFALFTNEEPPNTNADMGSLVYARQCRAHRENIVAMMSLESIGYYSDTSGSQKFPFPLGLMYPPVGNFLGFVGNLGSRGLVRQAIGSFRQSVKLPTIGLAAPAFIKGVDWSDHASFWEAGYPGIMITDTALFRNPHYHKPTDTPDRIDYDRLARITNGLEIVTASLTRSKGGQAMTTTQQFFSLDYTSARQRFRDAVQRRGGQLESLAIDARGPSGEPLTIDTAWFGASRPRRVLVHSSGLHGVEEFAGSAIQLQWLQSGVTAVAADTAIVLVHVMNPYGMAWLRRVNENNVDLNRNFLAADETYSGAPDGYRALSTFLNPATPPSADFFYPRAAWHVLRKGLPALRQAVAGGQYEYPKGLFFGGQRLEEGTAKVQAWLAGRLRDAERIVAIDVHTGLGQFGQDRLLVDDARERTAANREMRMVFGDRVQLMDANLSVAYKVRGAQHSVYFGQFPKADVFFASQEFGTYNPLVVVAALRAENRWHHYGDGGVTHPAKAKLLDVFCPASERWRQAVLQRGSEVVVQAQTLLASVRGRN